MLVKKSAIIFMIVASLAACGGIFGTQPSSTPTPDPVVTPVPIPTEIPIFKPQPAIRGTARITVRNVHNLRFGYAKVEPGHNPGSALIGPGRRDYYTVATFFLKQENGKINPSWPVLEISLRGNVDEFCADGKCDKDKKGYVGVWIRANCNVKYEGGGPEFYGKCGSAIPPLEYRGRLPVGVIVDGKLSIDVAWTESGYRVSTPAASYPADGSFKRMAVDGCLALGGVLYGVPPGGIGLALPDWDAVVHGATVELESWEVLQELRTDPEVCPVQ